MFSGENTAPVMRPTRQRKLHRSGCNSQYPAIKSYSSQIARFNQKHNSSGLRRSC